MVKILFFLLTRTFHREKDLLKSPSRSYSDESRQRVTLVKKGGKKNKQIAPVESFVRRERARARETLGRSRGPAREALRVMALPVAYREDPSGVSVLFSVLITRPATADYTLRKIIIVIVCNTFRRRDDFACAG